VEVGGAPTVFINGSTPRAGTLEELWTAIEEELEKNGTKASSNSG
jgi:hypothetical protein